MRRLSLGSHTLFADLQQKAMDASFIAEFPENGSFSKVNVKGRDFVYYNGYRTDAQGEDKRYKKYVGLADDPQVAKRVADFAWTKTGFRARRELVQALVSMGLRTADAKAGNVVETLWKIGAFRLRCVLVGTTAFQTYGGLLGVHLPDASVATGDVDVAQFHSISMSVGDSLPPVLDVLRELDATWREIPHMADGRATCTYVNAEGFRLEFLTPNNSKEEYQDKPARMPALGGTSAQPLRFLDFLIHNPVHSVLLHKGGVPVLVPSPQRFAVHKLIVSASRRADGESAAKSRKDAGQSGFLIEAMEETGQAAEIGYAWMEAWERGPGWKERLETGRRGLAPGHAEALDRCILAACAEDGADPGEYGVVTDGNPKP